MSPAMTPHPSAADIANLASEKLGGKKTQRVLDHCKECPECADVLLAAVREQPVSDDGFRLSRWNWISIGVLLVTVILLAAMLVWFLRAASEPLEVAPVEVPSAQR